MLAPPYGRPPSGWFVGCPCRLDRAIAGPNIPHAHGAFALTYLLVFSAKGGEIRLSVEVDMILVGMASLFYGMLALLLALGMGGFTPLRVIESGGWRLALGLTRHRAVPSTGSLRRNTPPLPTGASPFGSRPVRRRSCSLDNCGSLVLLAIPFQVMLATIPLSLVLMFPRVSFIKTVSWNWRFCCTECVSTSRFVPSPVARRYITGLAWPEVPRQHLAHILGFSGLFAVVYGPVIHLHCSASARRRHRPQHCFREAIV